MKLWYSVEDCGDGSAYPVFFESEELANIHQESIEHITGMGWGEHCTGFVEILGEDCVVSSPVMEPGQLLAIFYESLHEGVMNNEFIELIRRLEDHIKDNRDD